MSFTSLSSRPHSSARSVWRRGNALFVGWAALPNGPESSGLGIVNLQTGAEIAFRSTPRLVNAVIVVGESVFASTAVSGDMYEWSDLACSKPAAVHGSCYADSFATLADELYWGARSGHIIRYLGGGAYEPVAAVRKDLYGIALDGVHVFGAYADGRIRGWPTFEPKKAPELIVVAGRAPSCTVASDGCLWTVDYSGQVVRYGRDHAERGRTKVGGGRDMMMLRAGTQGRVAVFTSGVPVRVLSPELELLAEVPAPGRVGDVWLDDDYFLVGTNIGVYSAPPPRG